MWPDSEKNTTEIDHRQCILANEIIENIEAGLESFKEIMEIVNGGSE